MLSHLDDYKLTQMEAINGILCIYNTTCTMMAMIRLPGISGWTLHTPESGPSVVATQYPELWDEYTYQFDPLFDTTTLYKFARYRVRDFRRESLPPPPGDFFMLRPTRARDRIAWLAVMRNQEISLRIATFHISSLSWTIDYAPPRNRNPYNPRIGIVGDCCYLYTLGDLYCDPVGSSNMYSKRIGDTEWKSISKPPNYPLRLADMGGRLVAMGVIFYHDKFWMCSYDSSNDTWGPKTEWDHPVGNSWFYENTVIYTENADA